LFISAVDAAVEQFLRSQMPLPAEAGDVSFTAPTPDWAAGLTRPTVNAFLRCVGRSSQLARAPQRRFDANGRPERRNSALQMVDLDYVFTVWAPDASQEHELLSRAVSLLAGISSLPTAGTRLQAPITVSFGSGEHTAPASPFAVAGPLKAYAIVTLTTAADEVDIVDAEQPPRAAATTS
jgi:hypothetical protein